MAHKYEIVAAGVREIISESLAPHDALLSERALTPTVSGRQR